MRFDTIAVHGGYTPEIANHAVAVPIYQTTSFAFDDAQHATDLFTFGKLEGNIYTRVGNPTQTVLETRLALLEGGTAALAVASGMAAVSLAIESISRIGDNVIVTRGLYGSSHVYFADLLADSGIEARFVDPDDPGAVAALADARTTAVFAETITNPVGNVTDLRAFADAAHRAGVPFIVDNTVPSPAVIRPIEHGADVVVHSLTKYLGGHGTSIGGAIIEAGTFPWREHLDKFPTLNAPAVAVGGAVISEVVPEAALVTRARAVLLRSTGAAISPFNAFLVLQGIETLPLRLERIHANALVLAEHLTAHPGVAWVNYPGLPDHPDHARLQELSGGRASGLLSFGLHGGREAGARFIDSLRLVTHLVNIGDSKTLACHPASTTHSQLTETELLASGLRSDLVRISVGIEDVRDLIEDVDQALAVAQAGVAGDGVTVDGVASPLALDSAR